MAVTHRLAREDKVYAESKHKNKIIVQ